MFRSAVLFGVMVLSLSVASGCGCNRAPKITPNTGIKDVTRDVPALIQKLDSKTGAEKITAMIWLRKLGSEAQPALGKLNEIAAKDKNPNVKKFAQDTIGIIQGQ